MHRKLWTLWIKIFSSLFVYSAMLLNDILWQKYFHIFTRLHLQQFHIPTKNIWMLKTVFFGFNNGIWQDDILQYNCIQIIKKILNVEYKILWDITESLKWCESKISSNWLYLISHNIHFLCTANLITRSINTPENVFKKYNQTYFKTNESNFWKLIRDKLIYHDRSDEP